MSRIRRTHIAGIVLALLLLSACGMGSGDENEAASDATEPVVPEETLPEESGAEAEPSESDAAAAGSTATEQSEPTETPADSASEPAAESDLSGDITFQTLQLQPTFTEYIDSVIADFEEQNPEVSVDWIDIPFEGAAEKVIADAAAGQLPDVINLNPDFALPLARENIFVNMDEAASDVTGDYVPGAYAAFEYPFLDHGVGLPWYLSTEVTMYNADHFEQAGLDPEQPPATFDELFDAARTIAEQTDHYGMHPALENRFLIDLAKMGVPIVNDDATEAAFNTTEAAAYLQQLVDLYESDALPPDSPTQTHRDEINEYQAGQISLFPSGANFLTIIEENAPDIATATRVGPQITGPAGATGMSVMGVMVPQSSENQEAAVEFAKFMTNAENQTEFAKIVTILPSVLSALEDPYFTEVEGDDAEAVARRISADQIADAEVLRPVVVSAEFNEAVVAKTQAALLGELSPQEALDRAAEEATTILQQDSGS